MKKSSKNKYLFNTMNLHLLSFILDSMKQTIPGVKFYWKEKKPQNHYLKRY